MEVEEPRVVTPGEIIGKTAEYQSGVGTYVRLDQIRASITGSVSSVKDEANGLPTLQVFRGDQNPTIVPKQGDVVVCKVCD
jgi:exosome complex RNA-binding protein Rrp4